MAKQNVNQVKISDEDLAKIQKAVEDSRPKGYFESMRQQISPKEAMEFVKENPEVLKLLVLKKGGKVTDENYDMLRGKIKEVKHHASELQSITNRKKQVPAWVLAKSTRASTDLSDITHYMDSQKFSGGGGVESTSHIQGEIDDIRNWDNDEIANYIGVPISYVARDRNRYVREAQNYMMLNTFETGGNIGFKELSSRVSKSYQGKAVAPKYQSQYGKKYSKSEARDVGDKVAGKVYRQQQGRKFDSGGKIQHTDDLKVGDKVFEYTKDSKFESGYFEGKTRGLILRMDGAMAQVDFGNSQIYWIPIKDLKKADKYSGGGGVEEIKVGDIVGNTVQGFNFEILDVEDGSQLKVKDVRTGRIFNTYFGNMYKSYTDKYSNGGKVRKMELYDAVLYNGKQYDISKKDGIVGLKNLSQGAYGSDYPFIPLSKININEVTDMYGNKVEISEIYMNGGNVGGLSDLMFG